MYEAQLIPYKTSDIPQDKNILVLAPHPDDEVFGCGGAIALHVESGCDITVVLVTSGSMGGDADTRIKESKKASEFLGGYSLEVWGYVDREVLFCAELVERIKKRVEEKSITLVYAPSPWENHPDHKALSASAMEVVRESSDCSIMFYEVGAPLRPNILIDISTVLDKKISAMQCFASQIKNQRYDEHILALNRYRTYTLPKSIKSAEAYEYYTQKEIQNSEISFFKSEYERQKKLGVSLTLKKYPLVNILIRSVNKPQLQKALYSAAAQTYKNIEIFVVNAAGKPHDFVPDEINGVKIHFIDSDIALERAKAANIALENVNAKYALFLDDDDWITATHIEKLVDVLEEDASSVLAYSDTKVVDENAKELGVFNYDLSKEHIYASNFMPIHSVLFRCAVYIQNKCRFDESFAIYEDWDFWIQLSSLGEFKHVGGIGAYYVIAHGGSSDAHNPYKNRYAKSKIFEKWHKRWGAKEIEFLANEATKVREILSLKTTIKELEEENRSLKELNEQILNSRSWKLIAILRKLKKPLSMDFSFFQKSYLKLYTKYYIDIVRKFEHGDKNYGKILYQTPFVSKNRDKLCFFSHYDKNGIIDPYVIYYLEKLLSLGCDIVFVSTAKNLAESEIEKIKDICAQVILKENIGYDFGSWKTALGLCETLLLNYEKLLFCNDSVYAPVYDLQTLFLQMQERDLDMWGITESRDMGYHLQSYFLVFDKKIFQDPKFLQFWENYTTYKYKRNVIEHYEVGLSRFMMKNGYKLAAYCSMEKHMNDTYNMSHFSWKSLITDKGSPFIKIELFRDNPMMIDLSEAKNVILDKTDYPIELIYNHLKRVAKSSKFGFLSYLS